MLPAHLFLPMKLRLRHVFSCLSVLLILLTLNACTTAQSTERKKNAALRTQAKTEHAFYRSLALWKKNAYRNKALLAQATPSNVTIEIARAEQRGIVLVNGAIAMDFPVATGKSSHPTPLGSFTILDMKKDYSSNLYGKIYDATGNATESDADTRTHTVPEGSRFVGAQMPYWMRLTNTGVGMHVGYVPGRPASHGCIRLKRDDAREIFSLVRVGTPVLITEQAPSLVVVETKKR